MWPRILNIALGVWLMTAPTVLGYADVRAATVNDRIVGPVATSMAIIAIWQVTRPARWVNVALGAWLLLAPWVLGYPGQANGVAAIVNSLAVGAAMLALGLVRGPEPQKIGGGWAAVLRAMPEEQDR